MQVECLQSSITQDGKIYPIYFYFFDESKYFGALQQVRELSSDPSDDKYPPIFQQGG